MEEKKKRKAFKYCSVPFCNTRSDKLISEDGKPISLHEFPSDQQLHINVNNLSRLSVEKVKQEVIIF